MPRWSIEEPERKLDTFLTPNQAKSFAVYHADIRPKQELQACSAFWQGT